MFWKKNPTTGKLVATTGKLVPTNVAKICDLILGSPCPGHLDFFLNKSAKEVEVLGEIHFLQNARLEGSLRFRKARVGEVPRDHRCVDVGDAQQKNPSPEGDVLETC